MKSFKNFTAATLLMFVLCVSTFAGEMATGGGDNPPPPPPPPTAMSDINDAAAPSDELAIEASNSEAESASSLADWTAYMLQSVMFYF